MNDCKCSKEVREYSKSVYHLRKKHNLCTYCGSLPAEPGTVFCAGCKVKKRKQSLNYYYNLSDERKQEIGNRRKERQRERKKKGLCIRCGAPVEKATLCEKHLEQVKHYQKEYRKRKFLKELESKNDK